jgi:hypothetical protein
MNSGLSNPTLYNVPKKESPEYNSAAMIGNTTVQDPAAIPQNTGELVRRNANTQLSRQALSPWDDGQAGTPHQGIAWEDYDDDEQLEQRAMEAMRDAIAKKRQIPPFVQKLSRYVVFVSCRNCANVDAL